MLLMTAIVPKEELRACKTTTNSSLSAISGVIVVSHSRNSFPRDSMLRNSIRSLYTLLTLCAYASFTAKYVKLVKFICRHADLPCSVTGGKYTFILRSVSKSSEDFWMVKDKSKLQKQQRNTTVNLFCDHYKTTTQSNNEQTPPKGFR